MGAGDKFKTYKHKINCPSYLRLLAFHNNLEILSRRQCFKKCVHVCVFPKWWLVKVTAVLETYVYFPVV